LIIDKKETFYSISSNNIHSTTSKSEHSSRGHSLWWIARFECLKVVQVGFVVKETSAGEKVKRLWEANLLMR